MLIMKSLKTISNVFNLYTWKGGEKDQVYNFFLKKNISYNETSILLERRHYERLYSIC